jgi:hypothetical protein
MKTCMSAFRIAYGRLPIEPIPTKMKEVMRESQGIQAKVSGFGPIRWSARSFPPENSGRGATDKCGSEIRGVRA